MVEELQVIRLRDVIRSELAQVWGHPLCIQQEELLFPKMLNQRNERDLRSIGHVVEHAFAEERRADVNTVQPAREFVSTPDFHAMGKTLLM